MRVAEVVDTESIWYIGITSKADHVGMVLRLHGGKLFILESTSDDGVALYEWSTNNMRSYCRSYERIVYRNLKFARSFDVIARLRGFLQVQALAMD